MSDQDTWTQLQAEVFAQKVILGQLIDSVAQLSGNRELYLRNLHAAVMAQTAKLDFFNADQDRQNLLREQATERAESLIAAIGGWHRK